MEKRETETTAIKRPVWNVGRIVGAKRSLKPQQTCEIGFYLNQRRCLRDRALFDLAIDSKLRECDLVQLKTGRLVSGKQIRTPAIGDEAENTLDRSKVFLVPRTEITEPVVRDHGSAAPCSSRT